MTRIATNNYINYTAAYNHLKARYTSQQALENLTRVNIGRPPELAQCEKVTLLNGRYYRTHIDDYC